MNTSISRLFVIVIILFAVLIGWTSRWTVFSATALDNNRLNRLGEYASWKVKRGHLFADDGKVLAESVRAGGGTWARRYPFGSLFAQPVGYNIVQTGSKAGLEEYRAPQLTAQQSSLVSLFGDFNGGERVGDDVYTTLDPVAQKLAQTELAGRVGSVVAIVPQTGAVKVMYSNPTYNDNNPSKYSSESDCRNAELIGCQFNFATQAELPPGSTFKIVTTAAALNSGKYTPESIINGNSPITVSGTPLQNDLNSSYGEITLTQALTDSVNTVYAQVGEALGAKVLQNYMERFGFYRDPPLDYPADQMTPSGERIYGKQGAKLVPVTNPNIDVGRTAIGQANLAVTPLQMAMVAATVANHGTLMVPRLTYKAVNADGQLVATWPAKVYHRVMRPAVAAELTQMMTDVVEEGTGQAANLLGIKVAGKTGTASLNRYKDGQPLDDAWFIGFAPISDPKIAVAVELENIPNGYGGVYAAPIAAQEIKTLLAEGQ